MHAGSSENKRRVLLMYITRVSGHRQATLAIQQALRQVDPHIEVPAINGFSYTYPVIEKIVNRAYLSVIKRTPKVWDYLYDNPKVVNRSQFIKDFIYKKSYDKLSRLFDRYKPDTVVCTQAFPCGMVAAYKRSRGLKTRLIGVLTDFAPHSFWINEGVDCYVVPSEEAKERFVNKGVPQEAIKVYGIPIRLRFAQPLDRETIFKRLELDSRIPTILVMGGGQGLGPIKSIVRSLIRIKSNIQLIVIAGTNKKIMGALRKYTAKTDKKMYIFEYVKNVEELMEIATLIVTKPGGITTAECLVKGLPMVIVHSIPGQEMRNTDFLIKNGIAIRIDDTEEMGEDIEGLIKSPEVLQKMRESALASAKPNATLDIVNLILNPLHPQAHTPKSQIAASQNYV